MDTPQRTPHADDDHRGATSRRLFVLAGAAAFLTGCASTSTKVASGLPGPWWTTPTLPPPRPEPVKPATPAPTGVVARSSWAKGNPVPTRMDSARRTTRITVHHDGMKPFTDTGWSAAANRLESIRRAHLRRKPQRFGDIGYHYAIDPAGRVWACRPLAYQGAHVAGQNHGNLGIVVLGNYDKQSINRAQQAALVAFLAAQRRQYGIGVDRIHTHKEMAATACPGESLQRFMVAVRRNGSIA
ncbi:MAG: peptidoglycan recognition protein family protein [Phycisphaerales bacterium]|nr:peptidoglycan recognition protein family protein [Phycisphaerales bacterium]